MQRFGCSGFERNFHLRGDAGSRSNTVTAVATDIAGNTNTASIKVTLSGGANQAPMVSAGANQMNVSPAVATLNGTATDDGLPNPPGKLTIAWSQDSGPAPALIANPTQAATTAQFTVPGVYVLRLTASDSVLSSSATTRSRSRIPALRWA